MVAGSVQAYIPNRQQVSFYLNRETRIVWIWNENKFIQPLAAKAGQVTFCIASCTLTFFCCVRLFILRQLMYLKPIQRVLFCLFLFVLHVALLLTMLPGNSVLLLLCRPILALCKQSMLLHTLTLDFCNTKTHMIEQMAEYIFYALVYLFQTVQHY